MGKLGKKELTSKNSVNVNSQKHGFIQKKKNQKPIGKVALINGSKTQSKKEQKQKENKELRKKDKVRSSDLHEQANAAGLSASVLNDNDLEWNSDDSIPTDNPEHLDIHANSNSSEDSSTSIEQDSDDDGNISDHFLKDILANLSSSKNNSTSIEENSDDDESNEEVEDEDESDNETDEEEEEEDKESESEEEAEESALGLKALLGSSIAEDDDDDEDFDGTEENDEDDDVSSSEEEAEEEEEKVVEKKTVKKATEVEDDNDELDELKADKRTIFVGNLPKDINKKNLTKLFKQFGEIDTLRLRGKIAKDINMSKRVAAITKNLHPKLKSVYAYIRYVSEESVKPALSMNNKEFEGNYLRVDTAKRVDFDPRKSVFLGNLNFFIEDNAVRKHFEKCGDIESVHIIRDNKTGVGKGFGYVNFKTTDAVLLALKLNDSTLLNRQIRVKPNIEQKSKVKHGKRSLPLQKSDITSSKKLKNSEGEIVSIQNRKNAVKRLAGKEKKQTSPQQKNTFQGQKADGNKKKNKNKMNKKKKQLAEKLIAKPKKPTN